MNAPVMLGDADGQTANFSASTSRRPASTASVTSPSRLRRDGRARRRHGNRGSPGGPRKGDPLAPPPCTDLDRASPRRGHALDDAVEVLADALIRASRRGVPVAGIKLDYDLTILDVQCRRLDGRGLASEAGPATCSTRSSSTGDSTSTARVAGPSATSAAITASTSGPHTMQRPTRRPRSASLR